LSVRLRLIALLAAVFLATALACGDSSAGGPAATSTPQGSLSTSLAVVALARDLGVGPSRMPLAVFFADQTRLDDRLGDLDFSYKHADDPGYKPLSNASWHAWPVRGGAYVTYPEFNRSGDWQFRVQFKGPEGDREGVTFVQVGEESSAPSIGELAPVAATRTAQTADQVRLISSAFNPDPDFYALSLDEALTNGRPTIVLFSTPAYCNTQTCGPQLDTIGQIKALHRAEIDFVHVEIWENVREMLDTGDQSIGVVAEAVETWGLITEPWTFFVDSNGIIVNRFEQFTTYDELNEATSQLLAGS
jgi:hypothetical protein